MTLSRSLRLYKDILNKFHAISYQKNNCMKKKSNLLVWGSPNTTNFLGNCIVKKVVGRVRFYHGMNLRRGAIHGWDTHASFEPTYFVKVFR
jgi:hypothetical protein